MGFLQRRRRSNDPGPGPAAPNGPRDAVFGSLTAVDADWMRATAHRFLAENGVEATLDADGATFTAADGLKITLDNVVNTCINAPREDWLGIVERHFGRLARSTGLPEIENLTPEQFRAQVRTRLHPSDALNMGGIDMSGYARPVADGLSVVLCVDFPETVTYLSNNHAAAIPDLDEAFRLGQANTDTEPIDQIDNYDNGMTVVAGESIFIASKVLNMPSLLARTHGRDAPNGVAFCVPDRSTVLLHVIDGSDAIEAIAQVAMIGAGLAAQSAYWVSPNLYYWRDNTIHRIGSTDPETKSVQLTPTDELMEILNSLSE